MEFPSASDQAVCSCCGKRPASNYICYGGTGKSAELCDECHSKEDPISASFAAEAKSATCHYCGGSPCGGGPGTISQITGGLSENRWLCMSCSPEYYTFMQSAFTKVSDGLTQQDQIERLKKIATETDAHMRTFVRRRDN